MEDEILRYAQNDKGYFVCSLPALRTLALVSEGDFATSQPVALATGRSCRAVKPAALSMTTIKKRDVAAKPTSPQGKEYHLKLLSLALLISDYRHSKQEPFELRTYCAREKLLPGERIFFHLILCGPGAILYTRTYDPRAKPGANRPQVLRWQRAAGENARRARNAGNGKVPA
jgi:hypothetical protein